MLDSNLQELRVMDYSTALQTVQSLESRGDFQFKGIHKMFLQVADWTEKYLANRILPNLDQIIREVSLEKEKGELFMKELCFRYNPPIFKKIVSVEFDPAGIGPQEDINTFLRRSTVFARPSNLDSGSAHRYVNGVNEASLASIKRWLGAHRVLKPKEVFIEFIISKIRDNKLNETYASYEIGKLFSCQYDTTKELREVTVNINLKPILKKLVSEKLLYFFRNDSASKSGNKSVFLFNNKDEIMIRVEAYLEYMKTVIVPELQKIGVIGDVGEEDYENFPELAKTIYAYMNDSYGDQKTVIEELIKLSEFHKNYKDEQDKKEKKEKLKEIMAAIESAGKLVDLSLIRVQGEPLTPELVQLVISNDQICFTEYSDHKNYFEYVLHKSCIPQAIEFAKLLYKNSNNDTEIRILARMNIGELVSPEQKKDFEQHELKSLFKYLSFFTRLWRSIFGNVVVHKFEANQIRARQEVLQRQRIQQQKMKKMEEEKTRIAESRMKIKAEKSGQDATNEETEETETEETGASMNPEQEKEVKEQMQNLVNIVDEGWNAGIYPDRTFLLQNLKGKMTEEQLVMFLKKYSQKELYSFIIKTHTEKFPWPILISRHYLKRYGRKLLDKAKKESDEQRSGLMPNQEKFDISSAIEDFLERTLPKI